ncbi:SWIM zinc finger family protein [Polymorphospora sp. NPDC051019]|uniref:SWIM zinc finger family protein n=1 Tax=Polymorphospora sp. NPDC051019 TaxID=3155725 RepID=UPI003412CDAE
MSADFADYRPPRPVEGGLRARSTRGAIGESWWARRFLAVLESFALGTRLTRGRSYARKGQVVSLDVAPGAVDATVQGSRPAPYRVSIGLRPFPDEVWDRLAETLAGQAFFSARLLAGDLPPELEDVFAAAGTPLFPASIGELDLRCNCPDFAVPCKHLAATFYLLAEAFDADPFQILHWRGRGRAELLAHLRTRRGDPAGPGAEAAGQQALLPAGTPGGTSGGTSAGARAGGGGGPVVGAAAALAGIPDPPVDEVLDGFWRAPVPLPVRPATLPAVPDLLLRQLGPPGAAIGGPGLAERLRPAYERFGSAEPSAGEPTAPAR